MSFDFTFACPQCGSILHAKDEWTGKAAICKACQRRLIVPSRPLAEHLSGGPAPIEKPDEMLSLEVSRWHSPDRPSNGGKYPTNYLVLACVAGSLLGALVGYVSGPEFMGVRPSIFEAISHLNEGGFGGGLAKRVVTHNLVCILLGAAAVGVAGHFLIAALRIRAENIEGQCPHCKRPVEENCSHCKDCGIELVWVHGKPTERTEFEERRQRLDEAMEMLEKSRTEEDRARREEMYLRRERLRNDTATMKDVLQSSPMFAGDILAWLKRRANEFIEKTRRK